MKPFCRSFRKGESFYLNQGRYFSLEFKVRWFAGTRESRIARIDVKRNGEDVCYKILNQDESKNVRLVDGIFALIPEKTKSGDKRSRSKKNRVLISYLIDDKYSLI